jgi:hypothetical protein
MVHYNITQYGTLYPYSLWYTMTLLIMIHYNITHYGTL